MPHNSPCLNLEVEKAVPTAEQLNRIPAFVSLMKGTRSVLMEWLELSSNSCGPDGRLLLHAGVRDFRRLPGYYWRPPVSESWRG